MLAQEREGEQGRDCKKASAVVTWIRSRKQLMTARLRRDGVDTRERACLCCSNGSVTYRRMWVSQKRSQSVPTRTGSPRPPRSDSVSLSELCTGVCPHAVRAHKRIPRKGRHLLKTESFSSFFNYKR